MLAGVYSFVCKSKSSNENTKVSSRKYNDLMKESLSKNALSIGLPSLSFAH